MNTQELIRLVDSISRDRNVDKETLYRDIEQAMVSAARKHFNAIDVEEFRCELDRISGKLHLWRGDEEIPLEQLGRIPAQTAKQVMIQRFREDERTSIYNEFVDRVGELTSGIAQRYEGGALIVTLGRAEGFMPRSEQIPGEQHQPGERVRCLLLDVRDVGNQVKIVLSRAHPDFIKRLFEVEVPEVAERIIEIKVMAREAGHRTKLAVSSIDSKVDAVGACVGVRGSRIKNIVDELGGEKIDIVRWNESSQILIQNSLKPAEVVEISLCFELGRATVVVNEDQLSLAIGKRGQNVRLAARLTNWDIDILTPAEFTRSLDTLEDTLRQVGVSEEQVDRLGALGIISVLDLEEVGPEYLMEVLECDREMTTTMIEAANARAKLLAEEQAREKAEAERRKAQEAQEQPAGPADIRAASILGEEIPEPAELPEGVEVDESAPPAAQPAGSSIIVDLLESRHETSDTEVAPAPASQPGGTGGGGSIVDMLEARQADAQLDEASPEEDMIARTAEETDELASEVVAEQTDSDDGNIDTERGKDEESQS